MATAQARKRARQAVKQTSIIPACVQLRTSISGVKQLNLAIKLLLQKYRSNSSTIQIADKKIADKNMVPLKSQRFAVCSD
jgi:hypothetical protein